MRMRKQDRQVFQQLPFINGFAAHYETTRVVLLQMYENDGNNWEQRRTTAINAYLTGQRTPISVRRYAW